MGRKTGFCGDRQKTNVLAGGVCQWQCSTRGRPAPGPPPDARIPTTDVTTSHTPARARILLVLRCLGPIGQGRMEPIWEVVRRLSQFVGANLVGAHLERANLEGVHLKRAFLLAAQHRLLRTTMRGRLLRTGLGLHAGFEADGSGFQRA